MKICIPATNDRGLDSDVSSHFGDAPFFVVVDLESGASKGVRNPECQEHHGSCHHVHIFKALDVDAVACRRIGRRAHAGLRDAGIDVLGPAERTVAETVEAIKSGRTNHLSVDAGCGGGRLHRMAAQCEAVDASKQWPEIDGRICA